MWIVGSDKHNTSFALKPKLDNPEQSLSLITYIVRTEERSVTLLVFQYDCNLIFRI